ncbi:hypothetical protein BDP81DRAFT_70192 [Colletotrichum phormii]|uniref:Uncharacterized protein n=1 Tax=Colletotrichum phormii TaxID=359342 RepID=A0AAI9ZKM0_9PEZI|nr:uncharacterized protein BDP81DRAFT_70192 [Colletotrichum phormii]KAK1633717.1 hypothetical protein BDP81DRAFT_70192 [Colletotrichum phormii]
MPPHLPDEVLAIIGILRSSKSTRERPNGPDYATLSKLCRVSKGFQQVVEPFLYESIFLGDDELSAFVVAVEHKPYLGSYVKELNISSDGLTGLTRFWLRKRLEERQDSADHSPFRRAIGLALFWLKLCGADLEGIYLLLLAMLLPEVEVLHFALNTEMMMFFIAEVDRPGPFPRLQQVYAECVEADWEGCEIGMPARLCEPFLSPTVQIFRGIRVEWLQHIKWRTAERMSLKSVHLANSLCNGTGMSDLLSRCPDLETLSIKWADEYLQHVTENDFPYYDEIGEALRRYGKNLRELELDCLQEFHYNCDYYRSDEELQQEHVGSLQELTRLKTLRLPLDALLGQEVDDTHSPEGEEHGTKLQAPALTLSHVLPSSLEKLELMSCSSSEVERLYVQIHDLLATGRMAYLRYISVKGYVGNFQSEIAPLGWNASILEHRYTTQKTLLITRN